METNLDRISAEIGFLMCDILKETYNIFEKIVKSFKNFDEFKSRKDEIISAIKEKLLDTDILNLSEEIPSNLITRRIKKIDKIRDDKEQKFDKLKKSPPKFDAKELERVVTKALGILIEDGAFAYAVWLESEGEDIHSTISTASLKLLEKTEIIPSDYKKNLRDAILDISSNIQKTLLARQLLERMLVYARYRAKALKGDKYEEVT